MPATPTMEKEFKLSARAKKLIKAALKFDDLSSMNEKRRDAFLDLIVYIKNLEGRSRDKNKK